MDYYLSIPETHYGLAFACSCAGNVTIEELEAGSDAIFAGQVVAVVPTPLISESVVLSVDNSWKGVNEKIVVVSTASGSTMCGSGFKIGHEYLIFASNHNGGLHTGRCGGTQPLIHAADNMQELDNAQVSIQYPIKIDTLSSPLMAIVAIVGVVAFVTLRKFRR